MGTDDFINPLVKKFAERVQRVMGGDLIAYNGAIQSPSDELIRDALEARQNKKSKLIFVLQTNGGSLDAVIRIVDTLRHHYPQAVEFIIPNFAFSGEQFLLCPATRFGWTTFRFSVLLTHKSKTLKGPGYRHSATSNAMTN